MSSDGTSSRSEVELPNQAVHMRESKTGDEVTMVDHTSVKTPRIAFVTCQVFDIEKIDIKAQEFVAELFLNVSWRDHTLPQNTKPADFSVKGRNKHWTPHLRFKNMRQQLDWERWFRIDPATQGRAVRVNMRLRVKAVFGHRFPLHTFPFDNQGLRIVLTSTSDARRVVLSKRVGGKGMKSMLHTQNFVHSDAWAAHSKVFFDARLTAPEHSASGCQYSELCCTIQLKRQPGYFVWNHMLPCFLISITPVVTYFIQRSLADKLSVTLTMVLTMIAFKFAISTSLPEISYFTRLDSYMLAGLVILFLGIAQNVLSTEVDSEAFDRWSTVLLYGPWLLGHALLLVFITSQSQSNAHCRRLHRDTGEAADVAQWLRLQGVYHDPDAFFQAVAEQTCKRSGCIDGKDVTH